jgi:hypothetical protein
VASKKKKKQRPRQRQSFAPTAPGSAAGPVAGPRSATTTPGATTPGATAASPSLASGISGPRRPAAAATTGTIDIDARVPYFQSDLRRVLITAAVMTALIVIGSLLIH